MCGITGFWGGAYADTSVATAMAERIASRGPDDAGVWSDSSARLFLAHRRLSILDLSPAGHQPMISPCRRYTLVYNGEIYNHEDLRAELDANGGGFVWRGHSDTETLLAALRHWGVEETLKKLNGMFAFAFWDAFERQLFLARDRVGEKPLYYGRAGGVFLFGSELKSLSAHPEWEGNIDRDALALYMRYSYVPGPWSIYIGISKLPPAHFVVIGDNGLGISPPQCYWDLRQVAESGVNNESGKSDDLIDELDWLLKDAVKSRMASDVPLGAFLSGGYDSTTVAAYMQMQSSHPILTFSIGFQEQSYNEAHYAKTVAAFLGTEHTELYVTPKETMDVIPSLPLMYDEPFADSSQIPTYLVSKLARQKVTVCLSGDGGDELFCGYNRYAMGYSIWKKLRMLPLPLRQSVAWGLRGVNGHQLELLQRLLPKRLRASNLADRLPKLAEVLAHRDGLEFYRALISQFKNPNNVVLGAKEPETILSRPELLPAFDGLRERMMYLDQLTYLPDDILTKVDRASMAVSLEARVPLLDHRLIEFAWRVPTHFKYRDGHGKWLLRQALYRHVPKELMERPKMGFGVPIEHWLRGPLKNWAEELLNESRLRDEGFLNPVLIRKIWEEHISGKRRWHYKLWNVLMFQAWLEAQR